MWTGDRIRGAQSRIKPTIDARITASIGRRKVPREWRWFWQRGEDGLKVFHPTWEGGGAPRDLAGTNHGILPATPPTWTGGLAGKTLTYDESDDYYTVADSPDLTFPAGNWTLLFYMRVPDNTGALFQYFFSWNLFATNPSFNIFISEDSSSPASPEFAGGLSAWIEDSSGLVIRPASSTLFSSPNYKMIILRKYATDQAHFYADGIDVHTGYASNQNDEIGEVNHTGALNIGRRSDNQLQRYFGGEISWWAKIDRDIGEDRIWQISEQPFGPLGISDVPYFVPEAAVVEEILGHGPLLSRARNQNVVSW